MLGKVFVVLRKEVERLDIKNFEFDFEKLYKTIQEKGNKELSEVIDKINKEFQEQKNEDNDSLYIMKYITDFIIPLIVEYNLQSNINSIRALQEYHNELIKFLNSNNFGNLND